MGLGEDRAQRLLVVGLDQRVDRGHRQVAPFPDRRDERVPQRGVGVRGPAHVGDGPPDLIAPLGHRGGHRLAEQRLAGAEVVADRGVADPGRRRDVTDRRTPPPPFAQAPRRAGQQVWLARLREVGSPGCFLQTLVENAGAVRFFARQGFAAHGPTPAVPGLRGPDGRRLHQQTMVCDLRRPS